MSRSADLAFHVIALQKRVLPKERLDTALAEAQQQGISLETYLAEGFLLEAEQMARVVRTRRRHGRACEACGETTFLLPRQHEGNTSCEHCGGRLQPQRPSGRPPRPSGRQAAPASRQRGPSGRQPAPRPPTGRGPRPSEHGAPPADDYESPYGAGFVYGAQAQRPQADSVPPEGFVSEAFGTAPPAPISPAVPLDPDATRGPAAFGDSSPDEALGPQAFQELPGPEETLLEDPGDQTGASAPDAGPDGYDRLAQVSAQAPGAGAGGEFGPQAFEELPGGDDFDQLPYVPPADDAPSPGSQPVFLSQAPPAPQSGPEPEPAEGEGVVGSDWRASDHDAAVRRKRLAGAGFEYEPPPPGGYSQPSPAGHDAEEAGDPSLASSAFLPPEAHRAQFAQERAPVPPIFDQLGKILTYPLQSWEGIALTLFGAIFAFMGDALPPLMKGVAAVLIFYPYAYAIRVTQDAMAGKEDVPSWPDFDAQSIALWGFQSAMVLVACFLPAILVFLLLLGSSAGPSSYADYVREDIPTIGPDAHLAAPARPYVATGTPVGDEPFVDPLSEERVSLATPGRWTVIGLLGRDTGDDTGVDQVLQEMPTGNYVIRMEHANQIHDLDRVAMALGPAVRILAAYADPSGRVIDARWPGFLPVEEYEEYVDEDEEEAAPEHDPFDTRPSVEDALQRAMRRAHPTGGLNRAELRAATAERRRQRWPPSHVQVVRTEGMTFPGPLAEVTRVPAVYVVDPQGRIAREYATGVYDQKLYADLKDLMDGGDGDAWAEPLPMDSWDREAPSRLDDAMAAVKWAVGGVLTFLLSVLGALYYPMAFLLMVAFSSGRMPFMYPAGIRTVAVATRDYLVVAGVCFAFWMLGYVVDIVLQVVLGIAITSSMAYFPAKFAHMLVWFYGIVVVAYAVGRYYYRHQDAIGWFTGPAQR